MKQFPYIFILFFVGCTSHHVDFPEKREVEQRNAQLQEDKAELAAFSVYATKIAIDRENIETAKKTISVAEEALPKPSATKKKEIEDEVERGYETLPHFKKIERINSEIAENKIKIDSITENKIENLSQKVKSAEKEIKDAQDKSKWEGKLVWIFGLASPASIIAAVILTGWFGAKKLGLLLVFSGGTFAAIAYSITQWWFSWIIGVAVVCLVLFGVAMTIAHYIGLKEPTPKDIAEKEKRKIKKKLQDMGE